MKENRNNMKYNNYKRTYSRPSRQDLVEVMEDTMEVIKKGYYELPGLSRPVDFRPQLKRDKKWTVIFDNVPALYPHLSPFLSAPKVYVQSIDVLEKAAEFGEDGVCLNMANAFHPGGGVLRGAMAQEEEICRRSTLTWSIFRFSEELKNLVGFKWDVYSSYPIKLYGAIWSPSVAIIKSRTYELLPEIYETNVITAAALCHPKLNDKGEMSQSDCDIMSEKIRTVLRIAALKSKRKLILGAWGCGAFCCPPLQIANLFKAVLEEKEFEGWFEEICFAVLDNPHRAENNYEIFSSVFGTLDQFEICDK